MEGEAEVVAWVASARRGDGEAFRLLYRRFAPSVHAVALARAGRSDAEDLVQESFLAAYRGLATLRDAAQFGPWIHAIARNAATDLHRRRAARPAEAPLDAEPPAPPAADDDGEFRGKVTKAIRALPEAYRETLLMRLAEGMTGPEIAAATGLTHGSVRVNLHRGMELLRERLREDAP
jgi:RNA polymerase sigma-70 factor (ECF subfamily)